MFLNIAHQLYVKILLIFATIALLGCQGQPESYLKHRHQMKADVGPSNFFTPDKFAVKIIDAAPTLLAEEEVISDYGEEEDWDEYDYYEEEEEFVEPTEEEFEECSRRFDPETHIVMLSNERTSADLKSSQALIVKVNTKKDRVRIVFEAAQQRLPQEAASLKGICFFFAGDRVRSDIEMRNFRVESADFFVRGERPLAFLNVEKDAEVGAVNVDIRGNQARFEVRGHNNFQCGDTIQEGNDTSVSCRS